MNNQRPDMNWIPCDYKSENNTKLSLGEFIVFSNVVEYGIGMFFLIRFLRIIGPPTELRFLLIIFIIWFGFEILIRIIL